MFELLGISLLLAALLTFNSLATVVVAALWRLFRTTTRDWSALVRARLLFLLRILPALLALSLTVLLVMAYLAYEPRHTTEGVSLKLGLLAVLSAIGISLAVARGFGSWRATTRLTADWMRSAERITIAGVDIDAYRVDHAFPVIAIVGALRARLFVASRILEVLTADEIAAAVAHENAHLAARDNLKRATLRACRDSLLMVPGGRSLDRDWAEASEEAADERAAGRGRNTALDLAAALVKIARIIPSGARPTMPAGVFFVGDEETTGIKWRVRRLVQMATADQAPATATNRFFTSASWFLSTLSVVAFAIVVSNTLVLTKVHHLIEHAVVLLK